MAEEFKVEWDSPNILFETIYTLTPGSVVRYSKNVESLLLRIETNKPEGILFKVVPITPGTTTYTITGDNALLVLQNEVVEIED